MNTNGFEIKNLSKVIFEIKIAATLIFLYLCICFSKSSLIYFNKIFEQNNWKDTIESIFSLLANVCVLATLVGVFHLKKWARRYLVMGAWVALFILLFFVVSFTTTSYSSEVSLQEFMLDLSIPFVLCFATLLFFTRPVVVERFR